jgi:hypothetical protein
VQILFSKEASKVWYMMNVLPKTGKRKATTCVAVDNPDAAISENNNQDPYCQCQ